MIRRANLLALGIVCCTAHVMGQVDALEPIDQAIEDVSVLSESLREIEAGLRQPTNFDQVYRVPVPGHKDLFMRIDGGLYAVFPQSVYVSDRGRSRPVIPNDTVFYIGPGVLDFLRSPGASSTAAGGVAPRQFDGRINLRIDPQPAVRGAVSQAQLIVRQRPGRAAAVRAGEPPPKLDLSAGPATIVSDTTYRAQRLRTLMRRAARARLTQRIGAG